jgi:hypothetical protein
VCAVLLALPMGAYIATHRAQVLARPADVSAMTPGSLLDSGRHWIDAWFHQGDLNSEFNLPGRPILDVPTGLLAVCGLIGFARLARRRTDGLLVLGFAVAAWLPSFLSDAPPNFSRAAGLILPIALVLGAGAAWLADRLRGLLERPAAGWRWAAGGVPLLLVVWAGGATFHDFHQVWVQSAGNYLGFEEHINGAADYVRDHTPTDEAVYFSPFSADHPDVLYRSADLAPRTVGGFTSGECMVVPMRPAVFVSLTPYEPDFERNLAQWANMSVLYQDVAGPGANARYTIFGAVPRLDLLQAGGEAVGRFGDLFEVRQLLPLPAAVTAGQSVTVTLGIRPLGPVTFPPSLFVHLYGNPTPYQGGPLWAQADRELCTSYPANLWRTDEMIIQSFHLTLPDYLPRGGYTVAVDIYHFPNGARLPVTFPLDSPSNYFALRTLSVSPDTRHGHRYR